MSPLLSYFFNFFGVLALASFYPDQLHLASENLEKGDYKESIHIYQDLIKRQSDQHSFLKLHLAIALIKDQRKEEAFIVFLDALNEENPAKNSLVTPSEKEFYQRLLKDYLGSESRSPDQAGIKMRDKLVPYYAAHPDHHLVGFLLSSAYANLGMFEEFFKIFFEAHHAHPSHYLSFKTKAILYIKLFERTHTVAVRENYREKILENLTKALEKNSDDTTLHKWLILFSKENEKIEVVTKHLRQLINENKKVVRSDIPFYVEQAVSTDQKELAQDFINKSKEWYQYSRVTQIAQEYLDNLEQSKG